MNVQVLAHWFIEIICWQFFSFFHLLHSQRRTNLLKLVTISHSYNGKGFSIPFDGSFFRFFFLLFIKFRKFLVVAFRFQMLGKMLQVKVNGNKNKKIEKKILLHNELSRNVAECIAWMPLTIIRQLQTMLKLYILLRRRRKMRIFW